MMRVVDLFPLLLLPLSKLASAAALPPTVLVPSKSQHDPPTRRQATPTSSNLADVCNQALTSDSWTSFGIDAFFANAAEASQPFSQGIQTTLITQNSVLAAADYTCGFQQPCVLSDLNNDCSTNPGITTILKAMANFSNFFQELNTAVGTAVTFIQSQAAAMPGMFNPANTQPAAASLNSDLTAGFSVVGTIASLIPGLSVPATLTRAIGPLLSAGQATPNPVDSSGFDSFANISASLGATQKVLQTALQTFVTNELTIAPPDSNGANTTPYEKDPNQLPQIFLGGTFAAPAGDLPPSLMSSLTAVLAAPGISLLWNSAQVVVAKVSAKGLMGFDPCVGNNLFDASVKFCDANGNAYIIQAIPRDLTVALALDTSTPFAVPGFGNLPSFNLNTQTIALSSESNQNRGGYFAAAPPASDFATTLTNLGPNNIALQDIAFFNLPLCGLDGFTLTANQMMECMARFGGNVNTCIFNTLLLCGCPQGSVNGVNWPYQSNSGGSIQCVLD